MRIVAPTFEEEWPDDIDMDDVSEVYEPMWTKYKWLWWALDPRMAWRGFQWNDISQVYEGWRPCLGELKDGTLVYAEPSTLKVNPPYDQIVTQDFLAGLRRTVINDAPPNIQDRMVESFDRMVSFIDLS